MSGAEVFTVALGFGTALVNGYVTIRSNNTIDGLSKAVTDSAKKSDAKWRALDERFSRSQTQFDRLLDMLEKRL
jgi:hypothetical protein